MKNLIIYGGSFDPPHNGHLAIAKAAVDRLGCSLLFVPAKNARWKDNEASVDDRLNMTSIAVSLLNKEMPNMFAVSDFEMKQENEGPSYSIDTVRHFAKETEKLYFIIGADQVELFDKWKDPDDLASLAQIIYVTRPGNEVNEKNVKRFHMLKLEMDEYPVSSTEIRDFNSIDYPVEIRKYVEEKKLYLFKEISKYLKPSRLEHSISVANVALEIAKRNPKASSEIDAYKAGLLHDIGKYLNEDDSKALMKGKWPDEYLEYPPWAFHQWTGSTLAKERFGVEKEDILEAIAYHCTGRPHMGPLEQIIYSADKIDPLRGYDSKPLINACLDDYHKGFITVLEANREYLAKKKLHTTFSDGELTNTCYEYYLDKGEKE